LIDIEKSPLPMLTNNKVDTVIEEENASTFRIRESLQN